MCIIIIRVSRKNVFFDDKLVSLFENLNYVNLVPFLKNWIIQNFSNFGSFSSVLAFYNLSVDFIKWVFNLLKL